MKNLLFAAFATILCFGLVCCGDDENKPKTIVTGNEESKDVDNTFSITGVWVCKSNVGDKILSINDNKKSFSFIAIPANEHYMYCYSRLAFEYNEETNNIILDHSADNYVKIGSGIIEDIETNMIPEDLKLPDSSFMITRISNDKISIGSDVYSRQNPITSESFRNSNWLGYTYGKVVDDFHILHSQENYNINFSQSDEVDFQNIDNNMIHYELSTKWAPTMNDSHRWDYGWNTSWKESNNVKVDGDLEYISIDFLTTQFAHFTMYFKDSGTDSNLEYVYGLMFSMS